MESRLALLLGRRLVALGPVVLAIASVNFLLLHLAPGDAAQVLAGQSGQGSAAFVARLRHDFGLDQPLLTQFVLYLRQLARFDLGYSFVQQTPVGSLILERLPATLLLMTTSLALACGAGVTLGAISALRRGTFLGSTISIAALVTYATPIFWLGLMLIILFSVELHLLPSGGFSRIGVNSTAWDHALDIARHLVLPAVTLGIFYAAVFVQLMRISMLEVLGLPFIAAARAKGLGEGKIAWSHAAPNAMLSVITVAGVMIGNMLGGSVLIETVFGWPGLGRLVFESLQQRDLSVLLGVLFLSSLLVVGISLMVDLLYGWLDPRIVQR